MKRLPAFAQLALASGFLLWSVACATSEVHAPQAVAGRARATTLRPQGPAVFDSRAPGSLAPRASGAQEPGGGRIQARLLPVGLRDVGNGQLRLFRPWLPPDLALEVLSVEEVRPLLTAFASLHPPLGPRLRLLEAPGLGLARSAATRAETKLREEFLGQFGPALLPLPESLVSSRLLLALQLSTPYMAEGVREAARELFNSPAFVLGVGLSIGVYFAAWLAPEPFFSVRPDGVRHNTNYVSNPRSLKDELEAFESMVRSDPGAIHELYQLNGTLVRRFVPPGVSYP